MREEGNVFIATAFFVLAAILLYGAYEDYTGLQQAQELMRAEIRIGIHKSVSLISGTEGGWLSLLIIEIPLAIVCMALGIRSLRHDS